jgi:hypothetical protein
MENLNKYIVANLNKYRIIKKVYHNGYGETSTPTFYVQLLKPFLLFWKRWVYIKHTGYGGYNSPTTFDSEYHAQCFIKGVLCKEVKTNSYSRHILGEYDCNTINDV